ncbi:MAG: hypothetical protein HZA89_10580 [Verrucomicrobia bacterium]|nr:hypothetical protein [Verrucomicrobiota bacterium]
MKPADILSEGLRLREEKWRAVTPAKFLDWLWRTRSPDEAKQFFADWLVEKCRVSPIHAYTAYLTDDAARIELHKKLCLRPFAKQVEFLRRQVQGRKNLHPRLASSGDFRVRWPSLGELQDEFHHFLEQQAHHIQHQLSSAYSKANKRKKPTTSIEELLAWAKKPKTKIPKEIADGLGGYERTTYFFFKCPDWNVRTTFATPHIVNLQLGEGIGHRHFESSDEHFWWREIRTDLACLWPGRTDNPIKEALMRLLKNNRFAVAWDLLLELLCASLPQGPGSTLPEFDDYHWAQRIFKLIPSPNESASEGKHKCIKECHDDLFAVCVGVGKHPEFRNCLLHLAFKNRQGLRHALEEFLRAMQSGTRRDLRLRELNIGTSYAAAKAADEPPVTAVTRTVFERTGRNYPLETEDKTKDQRIRRDLVALNVRSKRRSA